MPHITDPAPRGWVSVAAAPIPQHTRRRESTAVACWSSTLASHWRRFTFEIGERVVWFCRSDNTDPRSIRGGQAQAAKAISQFDDHAHGSCLIGIPHFGYQFDRDF